MAAVLRAQAAAGAVMSIGGSSTKTMSMFRSQDFDAVWEDCKQKAVCARAHVRALVQAAQRGGVSRRSRRVVIQAEQENIDAGSRKCAFGPPQLSSGSDSRTFFIVSVETNDRGPRQCPLPKLVSVA